ncbi:MAG: phasin family protein [Alphaproteobacteria bacterium]
MTTVRAKTTPAKIVENISAAVKPAIVSTELTGSTVAKLDEIIAAGQKQFHHITETTIKSADEMTNFTKQNIDAFLKSATTFSKGFEEISRSLIAYSQNAVEHGLSVGKAAIGARTIKEFSELQVEFAKNSLEAFVSEATKISDISLKLANEAFDPLTQRVQATVEKIGKTAA